CRSRITAGNRAYGTDCPMEPGGERYVLRRVIEHGTSERRIVQGGMGVTKSNADLAKEVLARCDVLAGYSEEAGRITRTFLCAPMRDVHRCLSDWMRTAGMTVRLDP